MSIPQLTTDLNHIQALDDLPNDVTGLTPSQLKGIYDQASNEIKDYINSTLIPAIIASNMPVTSMDGIVGNDVQTVLINLLAIATQAQAGTIINNSIVDAMLIATEGQIKERVSTHIADSIRHITTLERTTWNDVQTVATANKLLKLDSNARLPTGITGIADGNARIISGTYAGDTTSKTISIGFTPKLVLLFYPAGGFITIASQNIKFTDTSTIELNNAFLNITTGGFHIVSDANISGFNYAYVAIV